MNGFEKWLSNGFRNRTDKNRGKVTLSYRGLCSTLGTSIVHLRCNVGSITYFIVFNARDTMVVCIFTKYSVKCTILATNKMYSLFIG